MGNLFGRKTERKRQPSRVTDADKAVLQLKQQRDKLKQYQKKIQLSLEKERQLAKTLLHEGKKDKALLLLRKKKYQETTIAKTDNQLDTIEQLVHDLEFSQIESQVVQGLKKGNESLKVMQEIMSIEDVEKIMDETAEAVEFQRQISDLLSTGLTEDDEADVNEELEALLAEESADVEVSLPNVPSDKLPENVPASGDQIQQKQRVKKQAVLAS